MPETCPGGPLHGTSRPLRPRPARGTAQRLQHGAAFARRPACMLRPMRFLVAPALLAAALALGGCFRFGPIETPPPRPLPTPADAGQLARTRPAVERLLAAEVARVRIPSLAFGVVTRGGLVYFVGLGERD